jgi:signal transduction histidine kinase
MRRPAPPYTLTTAVRLQTKLTLAFAAVALAPIAGLTATARVVIANQSRGEFRRSLDDARADVEREYQRLSDELSQATARMARPDDPLLGPLLIALSSGPLDDDHQRDLEDRAEAEMHALGFDVLELVDAHGEVLAAAHFPGRVGDRDPSPQALARAEGRAELVDEQVMEGGRARRALAIESARTVRASFDEGRRPEVTLVAGHLLGADFLARLPRGARLLDADGKLLSGAPASAEARSWPTTTVTLARENGAPAARVELAISDAQLRRTLARVTDVALALGLGGLMLALFVGALVAHRLSTPLGELADAARALSRGQLDRTVPVRGSDEVAKLAHAWNGMVGDLETAREELVRAERLAAWREIAQRIAHEIKNPLTPIQMAIETLDRAHKKGSAAFDALFAESARTILDEVARLKNIVAEFSSFARLPPPRLAPLALGEVVESALALYASAGLELERDLAAELPPALADRDQMTQVLLNLLENARDAVASSGGRIRVATRAQGKMIELEVADTGPGLTDEARARLFTPYFTTKAKGTGLGLAIVHRIVTDHGGEIRVSGALGQGAVFTVAVPRA